MTKQFEFNIIIKNKQLIKMKINYFFKRNAIELFKMLIFFVVVSEKIKNGGYSN